MPNVDVPKYTMTPFVIPTVTCQSSAVSSLVLNRTLSIAPTAISQQTLIPGIGMANVKHVVAMPSISMAAASIPACNATAKAAKTSLPGVPTAYYVGTPAVVFPWADAFRPKTPVAPITAIVTVGAKLQARDPQKGSATMTAATTTAAANAGTGNNVGNSGSTSQTTSKAVAATTTTLATASSSSPIAPSSIGPYQFMGCWNDTAQNGLPRSLSAKVTTGNTNVTNEYCASFCAGNTYFGTRTSLRIYLT